MHFGADGAGKGARGLVGWPEPGVIFGDVFNNGQRVPDAGIAIDQQRNPAGGREGAKLVVAAMVDKGLQLLGEGNVEHAQCQPGAQRPG